MKYVCYFLLLPLTAFSQITSGTISYKLFFSEDNDLQKSDIGNLYQLAKKQSGQMIYELDFNLKESLFSPQKLMATNDITDINYAEIFSEVSGIYYRRQADSVIYNYVEDEGIGKLLINYRDIIKWKLLNETKVIDNYTCYKATSSYEVNNGLKLYSNQVVAWYCPDLPFQYGPKGFGGLPGLIFELQDQRVNFGIISIKQIKNLEIQKPEGGRNISLEEYNKQVLELNSKD